MIRRVELAFPVMDKNWAQHIIDLLDLYLSDNTKAWVLDSDGNYSQEQPKEGEEAISVQYSLLKKSQNLKEERKEKERKNWFARLSEKLLR